MARDRQLERFAQQAEDDRVLARVVAGAHGVVADLVVRPLARAGPRGRGVCSVCPIASAMISPNFRAVPLGASSLKR